MKGIEELVNSANFARMVSGQLDVNSAVAKMMESQRTLEENLGVNLARKMKNQMGMNSAISQMLESQERLKKFASPVFIPDAVLESIRMENSFLKSSQAFDAAFKSAAMPNIPDGAFDAINSLKRHHEELFGNLDVYKKIHQKFNPFVSEINNMHLAMDQISRQISAMEFQRKHLSQFKPEYAQTSGATNNLASSTPLTEEEVRLNLINLIAFIVTFLKTNKKYAKYVFYLVNAVLAAMALHQYYDFITKSESVTKEDLVEFRRKIIQEIAIQFKEEKEYRTTNTVCNIRLKPKIKTLVLTTLPIGFDVIVLANNHKWLYVSFINPNDNMPQTGWVFKKYLSLPK